MAKRKRASLKDKGPEALGLTQKKSKGIDVLFGGPPGEAVTSASATSPEPESAEPNDTAEFKEATVVAPQTDTEFDVAKEATESTPGGESMPDELTGAGGESSVTSPPIPPINSTSAEEVDEFGLPVATEAPPDDLEFAPPPEPEPAPVGVGGEDAFDPFLSPFATPAVSTTEVDDDLSGLLEEEDLTELALEADTPAMPPVATMPAEEFPEGPADDLPDLPSEPAPAFEMPPAPSPTPGSVTSPPSFTPTPSPAPAPVQPAPPVTPPAPVAPPPPVTSAPTPTPAPVKVEAVEGMVTEPVGTTAEDLLPADIRYEQDVSNVIAVHKEEVIEKDSLRAARVSRYIGRERRENLDMEIERLYNEVAKELSVNKTDAEYALQTLSQAQDIVFEDTRQYDEALYRVAVVKTMLARKQNLRRWSYTWGLAVFFYALVWLAAFLTGFLVADFLRTALGEASEGLMTIRGAWFSALAGGVGGIIGIFYSLYWHVAMKQDFDRQYVMYYLVQPIMGFVLGALIYFIVLAGFLIFRFSDQAVDTVTALGVVLGFVAGFRQRVVFEMIDRIVKRLLPRSKDEPDADPVSLVPAEAREKLGAPPTG